MRYKVKASDGKLQLNVSDTVKSILQNVAVIIATPKGSVPMYRVFGLAQDFVDKPMSVIKPMLFNSVREAVETFEPRVTVLNVTYDEDEAMRGKIIPIVEVDIPDEQEY